MLSMVACERKPLYLRAPGNGSVDVSVYDVKLDLLWGFDWETQWQYEWDSTLWGPIGYTTPDIVRAFVYGLDHEAISRQNCFTRNFAVSGGRVSLESASWYDMLFFNGGTSWIQFDQATDYSYYNASTRASSRTSYSDRRKEISVYPDYNQPDELFGTFLQKLYVSDDPDDYEITQEADGTTVYIYHIDACLRPYTFIYLIQVMLLNNYDEKGMRVKGCQGMSLDGVSQGVELYSRCTYDEEASVTADDVKPIQPKRALRLPNGQTVEGDIFASRLLSWGLPGIVPLDHITRSVQTDYENHVGMGLVLRNGRTYNISSDITEQMQQHPTGGVITVVYDASEVPDSIINADPTSQGGGGFNANVEDWSNEQNAEINI